MRRILWMATGCALLAPGCATMPRGIVPAAIGPGLSYASGKASQEYAFPLPAVARAVTDACEDLQIRSVRTSRDGPTLLIEGTTADNRGISVIVRPSAGGSRATARIGWFGDPPYSKALLTRVGVRLGILPPSAPPREPPSEPDGNPYFSRGAISDETMLRDQADALYRDSPVP